MWTKLATWKSQTDLLIQWWQVSTENLCFVCLYMMTICPNCKNPSYKFPKISISVISSITMNYVKVSWRWLSHPLCAFSHLRQMVWITFWIKSENVVIVLYNVLSSWEVFWRSCMLFKHQANHLYSSHTLFLLLIKIK